LIAVLVHLAAATSVAMAQNPAQRLIRRVRDSARGSVVIFTAPADQDCRRVIDQIGWALMPTRRVRRVDGRDDQSARDFVSQPTQRDNDLLVVHRSPRREIDDALVATLGDLILDGGERRGWWYRTQDHVTVLFESRPLAKFLNRGVVRETFAAADLRGEIGHCTYHVFDREILRGWEAPSCARPLGDGSKSGWAR
jgi:hypothetical protein